VQPAGSFLGDGRAPVHETWAASKGSYLGCRRGRLFTGTRRKKAYGIQWEAARSRFSLSYCFCAIADPRPGHHASPLRAARGAVTPDREVGACPAKLEQRESEDGRAFAALDADDISEEEWRIIEERAARCDLVSDEQVEAVFSRYRNA